MTETTRKKTATNKSAKSKSLVKSQTTADPLQKKILIAIGAILALLIMCVAYIFYALNSAAGRDGRRFDDLSQQLADLDTRIGGLQQSLSDTRVEFDRLAQSQQGLADAIQVLQQERPDSDQDWTLREVEYLVLIAMHRLHLDRDINTAITALQVADQRVRQLGNPALASLREQLAADINALKVVEEPDITGMAATLTDLGKRIETLPLKNILSSNTEIEMTPAVSETETHGWRQLPALVWNELKSLVVIKRNDPAGAAFIMPNEEYYLFQNLKLELANARLALLGHDSTTFRSSIERVELWLHSYFNQESTALANTLTTLGKMRDTELKPVIPDISASLEAVRRLARPQ